MKNYYEILEVDMRASKEIIEKAFKVLAKRYHPDTKSENKKAWAEAKFKEINEAYEVLSNEEKRKNYNIELEYDKNSLYDALCAKNEHLQLLVNELQNELNYYKKQNNTNSNNRIYYHNNIQQKQDTQSHHHNNTHVNVSAKKPLNKTEFYKQFSKNRLNDLLALLVTILCVIALAFLLWKIPFTNKFLVDLYTNNPQIKAIVDLFLGIFN